MTKEGYEAVTNLWMDVKLLNCSAEKPDIIIWTLMLPEIDGLEVAKNDSQDSSVPPSCFQQR